MRKIELGKLEIGIPDDTPRLLRLERELTLLKMTVDGLRRNIDELRRAQPPTKKTGDQ